MENEFTSSKGVRPAYRLFAPVLGIACMTFLAAHTASAAESQMSNSDTGSRSENENSADVERDTSISIRERTNSSTRGDIEIMSGNNAVTSNTLVEDVSTGDGVADISIRNRVTPVAEVTLPDALSLTIISENEATGFGSENRNEENIRSSVEIEQSHQSSLRSDFQIISESGGNEIDKNTVVGAVTTGDLRVEVSINNEVGEPEQPQPSPEPTPGGNGGIGGNGDGEPAQPEENGLVERMVSAVGGAALPQGVGGFFPAGGSPFPLVITLIILAALSALTLSSQKKLKRHQ